MAVTAAPSGPGSRPPGLRRMLTAAALLAVMGLELLRLASGWAALDMAVWAAMLAVAPLAAPGMGLREAYLLSVCAVLTGLILHLHPDPATAIGDGLAQAAFLMAFILLLGLPQQAATTSPSVRDCGLFLTRQPAGRRYFSVFLGAHVMAQLFNLGVISLLAPLIKRGTEETDDPLNPIRERRQLNAMLRGFAWCVVWSPTAVAPLVLLTLLPEAQRLPWIAAGAGIAVVILFLGWGEDRYQWRAYRRGLANLGARTPPPLPKAAARDFGLVCAALIGLTGAAMLIFGQNVIFGLMAACPLLMLGWLLTQNGGLTRAAWRAARRRIGGIVAEHLPSAGPLAVTLACSGYIGRAAAALIPAEDWASAIGLQDTPGWVFLLGLTVAVAALSQFGMSPIMMAVFFGALIGALPELPADPTWSALAISCGWALSMTASPFATVVLMASQSTGHSGRELTWEWNWRFSLLSILVLAPIFWALDHWA